MISLIVMDYSSWNCNAIEKIEALHDLRLQINGALVIVARQPQFYAVAVEISVQAVA